MKKVLNVKFVVNCFPKNAFYQNNLTFILLKHVLNLKKYGEATDKYRFRIDMKSSGAVIKN